MILETAYNNTKEITSLHFEHRKFVGRIEIKGTMKC